MVYVVWSLNMVYVVTEYAPTRLAQHDRRTERERGKREREREKREG